MNEKSGIILIDKEANMTSFDVCRKVGRAFFTRSVGHTGTLDPNATGLMVVLVNKATKILPYLQKDSKVYEATMVFGKQYDTGDIWGNVLAEAEVKTVTEEEIFNVLNSFEGKQTQTPPMYSAIKINGRKLYEYARNNEEVNVEPREIEIFSLELLFFDGNTLSFRAHVSSGTYIRTLCEDIAKATGNLGAMSALRRTKVGAYSLEDAYKLSEVSLETPLLPIDAAVGLPVIDYANGADIFNGRDITLDTEAEKVLIRYQGECVAVYARKEGNVFHCERGLW